GDGVRQVSRCEGRHQMAVRRASRAQRREDLRDVLRFRGNQQIAQRQPLHDSARNEDAAERTVNIDRTSIEETYRVIRPYVRRTPTVDVDGADFGLDGVRLTLKLELTQHTGSFKTRGAFANLLTREIPAAGVVAASGGNHGVAVAYTAGKLGHPVRVFVPTVASPAKMERIRGYGAELVVTGERYADALAASEEWVAQSGALAVHAYDQVETMLGQGSVGLEFEEQS